MLCFHARLFVDALWSPAGKGLTSWILFVMSYCDVVTVSLVSWVRCGAKLNRFLIFALFHTFLMTAHNYVHFYNFKNMFIYVQINKPFEHKIEMIHLRANNMWYN